jgi:hypothetical protein
VDEAGRLVYYKRPGDLTFEGLCRWTAGGDFMQPSCFFRRSAWEAAGPLDEGVHIALDVDLWLRMARETRFQGIDALLSTSLAHPAAKTRAFRDEMLAETFVVVIKRGGERIIQTQLIEMAKAAKAYEASRFKNRPLVKPIVRLGRAVWRRTVGRAQRPMRGGKESA